MRRPPRPRVQPGTRIVVALSEERRLVARVWTLDGVPDRVLLGTEDVSGRDGGSALVLPFAVVPAVRRALARLERAG